MMNTNNTGQSRKKKEKKPMKNRKEEEQMEKDQNKTNSKIGAPHRDKENEHTMQKVEERMGWSEEKQKGT